MLHFPFREFLKPGCRRIPLAGLPSALHIYDSEFLFRNPTFPDYKKAFVYVSAGKPVA